ncbi:response regulator [Verrucomicrobium sp. BvORR034]|uniref:response regulator n=1 Tax=Verrucomicrobium sp. BvORR034 TaxID=1396418 RepID=UPI0006785FD3|nr:response regulator [Verrucomicrobium sp. BvORR034]
MSPPPIHVYIVDDDPSVRTAYARLLRSALIEAQTFSCVEEFLNARVTDANACVVSDIVMPGTSGLELPNKLAHSGRKLPIIFITAHDSKELRNRAQSIGAVALFRKPVDGQALLDAIAWAVNRTPVTGTHPTEPNGK